MIDRRTLRVVLAALIATTVAVFSVYANGSAEQAAAAGGSIRGVVEYVQGDVTINGKAADFGQNVVQGDRVQTGADSQVQIVFNKKNIFALEANTIAVIDIGQQVRRIELKTGSFSGIFADLKSIAGASELQVQTPTAVGAVRGTTFFIKVLDQQNTYICACNGEVDMSGGTTDMDVKAPKHEAYLFSKASNGTVGVSKQPELYHTSEEMNALADKIGVTIPWGTIE